MKATMQGICTLPSSRNVRVLSRCAYLESNGREQLPRWHISSKSATSPLTSVLKSIRLQAETHHLFPILIYRHILS